MATTLTELANLMSRPSEDNGLEFKEAKSQFDTTKLFRRCVAIANEGGGKIILGITDKPPRSVVGSAAFPNPAKIEADIFNKLKFRVVVEELNPPHPDGRVLMFHVPSRPRGTAFQFEGQYLMRVGEQTPTMSEDRLREIFDEGKPDWLGELAMTGCSNADVVRLLDTQSFFDLLGLPYPTTQEAVLKRLESEKLIARDGGEWLILNLGAILVAKNLNDFELLTRRAPRVIVYDGFGKLKTRLDKPGTKGYAVGFEGLVNFVCEQAPSNEVIGDALRTETQMFPKDAIRELVANALIHQDFDETGSSVRIELYDDRLEISNPGVPLISTDRFIDEYKSRNEVLADLMRRFGICEEKSSGVDKVVHAAEFFQLPAPDFRVGEVHTTSVLFGHLDFEDMHREARIRACFQHCCLKWVMNQKMTNQTLRDRFKLSSKKSETASRILRDTIDAQKIKLADSSVSSARYRSYVPIWASNSVRCRSILPRPPVVTRYNESVSFLRCKVFRPPT